MKKIVVVTLLLASIFLFTGCSGFSNNGFDTESDYFVGTQALSLSFLEQAPPSEVFEESPFDLQVFLQNNGAFNLVDTYRATLSLNVIPYSALNEVEANPEFYADPKNIQLYGKSYYFPKGEENYFALKRYEAKPLTANSQTKHIGFDISLCYPYQTSFSTEICVDTDTQKTSLRKEVCSKQDLSFSKGQGAPIAITAVESNMVPRGAYVQPQFKIFIRNEGDGIVYAPVYKADAAGILGCGPTTSEDVGKVTINASLGNSQLRCTPSPVFLRNGEASFDCQLMEQDILQTSANYYTSLNIQLDYLYVQKYRKEISVKRTTSASLSHLDEEGEDKSSWSCYPWQHFDEATGDCINRCDYCAQEGRGTPECEITDTKETGDTPKEFSQVHTCAYKTIADCREAGDNCIVQEGLCPTYAFCGRPACMVDGAKNRKPSLIFEMSTPLTEITWYCKDADDVMDDTHICGCEKYAHYAIVEEEDSCTEVPFSAYNQVMGTYNPASARMVYSFSKPSSVGQDVKLCLRVQDTTGASAYSEVFNPFG